MYRVLVVNIGSTSFKYQLLDMDTETVLTKGAIDRVGTFNSEVTYSFRNKKPLTATVDTSSGYESCIDFMTDVILDSSEGIIRNMSEIDVIGFKTVHGGELTDACVIDEKVIKKMEQYADVVPAHNPAYIKAIKQFKKKLSQIPLVAVFETAFHKGIPDYASIYSVPYEWYKKYHIRRYGFHGASHRYIAERVSQFLKESLQNLNIISCHLGGSSSISAIKSGKSVENSMGFSTQTGVPMSNRCGDLDPFIIGFIMKKEKLQFSEVMHALTTKSGLCGISGFSGDIRDLEESSNKGHYRATLALQAFIYQIKKYIGGYAAILGGFDVLAFAGGIGENDPMIRRRICEGLEFLGIEIDGDKNKCQGTESIISKVDGRVRVVIIPTNEELIVAREACKAAKTKCRSQKDVLAYE